MGIGTKSGVGIGGGGLAGDECLFLQNGESDLGFLLRDKNANGSWHFRGVERTLEEESEWSTAVYSAGSSRLKVTFDSAGAGDAKYFIARRQGTGAFRLDSPEIVNTYPLNHVQWPAPDANSRKAFYDYGDLRATSAKAAAAGNNDWFVALPGVTPVPATNASVMLRGSNSSRVTVNSPPHGAKADGKYEPSTGTGFRIVAKVGGVHMNGFRVRLRYDASASAGNPTFAYTTSGSDITGLDIGGRSTTRWSQIVTGINALADPSDPDYAVRAILGGDGSRNIGSGSGTIANFTLSGGTLSIGVGQNSTLSTGQVRVTRSAARGAGGNTAKYEGSTTAGFLTFSWFEAGTGGNGFTILRRKGSGAGTRAFYEDNGNTYEDLVIHGPAGSTVGQKQEIKNAVNAARDSMGRQLIVATASAGLGQLAGFYPTGADIVRTLSGGTGSAATNPLKAVYDAGNNILNITCLPSDTWAEVIAAVVKLPQYQAGTGTNAGDIWVSTGDDTETIDTPSLAGQQHRYNNSGGVDAILRGTLRVTDTYPNTTPETLVVENVYSSTTVAQIIAAYSGSKFTLTSKSGNTANTVSGRSVSATRLDGGRGPILRKAPEVWLEDNNSPVARYQINYHGSNTPANQRSTLAELKTAWENIRGRFDPIEPLTIVITGTSGDRVSAVPEHPTGGVDYIAPSPIEMLSRPNDEVNGPNLEMRYHSTDTGQEIKDGLIASGRTEGKDFIVLWGTDLSSLMEEPGFIRGFYEGPDDIPVAPGSGLTKNQVDAEIRNLIKGYALRTGGNVPTDEIPTEIARVSQIYTDAKANDRINALVSASALIGNTVRWIKSKLPTDTVYTSDLDPYQTTEQVIASINSALTDAMFWADLWGATNHYEERRVVRNRGAAYISRRIVRANSGNVTEPGAGSNWSIYWYRIGFELGAPNSLTGVAFNSGNRQLTLTDRSGTAHNVVVPGGSAGGTNVSANPEGSTGDLLTRIAIGSSNYNLPSTGYAFYSRPTFTFNDDSSGLTGIDSTPWSQVILDSIAIPGRIYADWDFIGEWVGGISFTAGGNGTLTFSLKTTHTFNGKSLVHVHSVPWAVRRNATDVFPLSLFSSFSRVTLGSYTDENSNTITIDESDLAGPTTMKFEIEVEFTQIAGGNSVASIANIEWVSPNARFYQLPHGAGTGTFTPGIHPSIASFSLQSGNVSPVAGSIGNHAYSVAWAISQSDHVGSARIIGFKGDLDTTTITTLKAISGSYAHGTAGFQIPAKVSLAATETYTLRLQVFDSGTTNPGNATQPVAYHDIVITAHAALTAAYQWGYVEQVDGETTAQTAARIAGWTNWQDTDTTNGGRTTKTGGVIDTSVGYSGYAPDVSDSAGTNLFQFFLAVKSGSTKPTGWTANNLNADGAFQAAVAETVGSDTYTFYITKGYLARNHADGAIFYIPRTS